ncbi:ligand-binding sensor domain-containing protein [Maribellus mangrovi]|uniref:ligand-binding sensor domain-containing protein n=1 Tax=Maribellus mangrovi TaxID=3133146 RepID=UPI0030EC1750
MKQLAGILILSLLLFYSSYSQQYNFTTYSINEGLSQSVVNCIFQDSKGYIWLGTQNGLDRFDGRNFERFRYNPKDSNSISNNWIYAISEDSEGNLWIGTKGGLHQYIRTENRFERIRYQTGYRFDVTNYNYDNICLNSGKILINTPPIISVYDIQEHSFSHFISELEYEATVQDVRIPVMEDKNGKVWVGSTNGLALFSPDNGEFVYASFVNNTSLSHMEENVTALFQDSNGLVWAGTFTGLYRCEPGSIEFKEVSFPLVSGEDYRFQISIRSILQDKNNNLILGTEGLGVYIILPVGRDKYSTRNLTQANSGIGHDIVQPMLIDKSDNLWVGTLSGISKTDLKQKKFRLFRNTNLPGSTDLLGNVIAGLYKNEDGIIWVGNWGQGLNLVNPLTNEVEHFSSQQTGNHYLSNDFIHVIFKDNAKNMWLGTRDGVFIYDKTKKQFVLWTEFFELPDFPTFESIRIYHIIQDMTGNIWIASSNGLYKFNLATSTQEWFHVDAEPDHRLGANLIYSILEDSEGLIWAATINGLDMYDPHNKQMHHYNRTNADISSDFLISLAENTDGNIWIGSNAYINIFDKKTGEFSFMDQEQGLPSNYIYEMQTDKNNNIWLATGNGLCMFDTDQKQLEIYTMEDGLQSMEFNLRASCACADGELLFGGMNGFNTFYPDSITGNPYTPDLVFTSFSKVTDGEQEKVNIENGSELVLNHRVQSFTIEFAALEYTNPENNHYQYQMEAISDKWIEIGTRAFVPFFALPPGEYTFWIKGSNNDGLWNDQPIGLSFIVLPPWWRSKLAYSIYLLLTILGVVFFVKLRERRLKHEKILLEKKVAERTLQIEEQNRIITSKNEELNELNRTKDKFFSIIGHDLGNHFNIIVGFSELLLSGFRKMDANKLAYHLGNIHNSSKHASDLLGNLLTWARLQRNAIEYRPEKMNAVEKVREWIGFQEELAFKKNILVEVMAKENIEVFADENMFSLIIRNLLANALKFTPRDGEISIRLKKNGKHCEITVKDSGVGIPPEHIDKIFRIDSDITTKGTEGEKGTGLGLVLCKEFVEKHGGKIWVKSKPGEGSEFGFLLPLAKE